MFFSLTGDVKFECSFCEEIFYDVEVLNNHRMKECRKKKFFMCPDCNFMSVSRNAVKTHMMYRAHNISKLTP